MSPTVWKHLIAVALSVLVLVGLAMWNGVVAALFGLAALTWFLSQAYWHYVK
jgi:predicted membrane channel-forming protein YqfA (hemolysin III family)